MAENHNVLLARDARAGQRRKAGLEQTGKRPQLTKR
jgi:ribosomal protein S9